jgi:hypothetical protein
MDPALLIALGVSLGTLLVGLAWKGLLAWLAARPAKPVPTRRDQAMRRAATAEPARREAEAEPAQTVPEPLEPLATRPAIPEAPPPERRKHPRIRSDQTFVVTPFAGREMMAQCCDISAGGMRFGMVGSTLRAGDLVRVSFNIGDETVAAIGSVLRVHELDPITTDITIEFVRLDPGASQLLAQALETDAASQARGEPPASGPTS